jgi:hypothetical protein
VGRKPTPPYEVDVGPLIRRVGRYVGETWPIGYYVKVTDRNGTRWDGFCLGYHRNSVDVYEVREQTVTNRVTRVVEANRISPLPLEEESVYRLEAEAELDAAIQEGERVFSDALDPEGKK